MKPHPSETVLVPQCPSHHPMTKPRIIKNVVVLSVGCLVLLTAYAGLSMLQSTVNSEQGIGVLSQAVLYICFCVSALVFPKYVINKLGSKLTLVLSMLGYIPYVAANVYPHWSVMMPTSILIGFSAALLWGSQANYLNDVSVLYAELLLVSESTSGQEESCSIGKQSMGGCVYGSLDCPLERKEKDAGVLTSPQESGSSSNVEGQRLSSSSGDRRRCKSKSDGHNLNSEQIILERSNVDEPSDNQGGNVCLGSLTLTQKESGPSNYDEPSVGPSSGGRHSFEHQLNGQCPNSEQIHCHCLNKEHIISNGDAESNEHSCRSISDDKDSLKQIYSIALPNDSSKSLHSNIVKDIELKCPDSNDKLNQKDSTLKCPDSHDKDTDPNRKSVIESVNTCRKKLIESNTAKDIELNQKNSMLKCPDSIDKDTDPNRNSITDSVNTRRRKLIESTTARFFGFHGMVYLSSFIWSNLLTYFMMQREGHVIFSNCSCGANFCGADSCHGPHERQVMSDGTRYALCGVCAGIGVSAVLLVWLFLDPLDDKTKGGFNTHLLVATLKLAKRTELALLMPMSLYLGMAKAFFTGDITESFIGCAMGASSVGLVAAAYGTFCALSSLVSGWAVWIAGRPALFAVAALLNSASCVVLLAWTPDAGQPIIFYVVAGMWGLYVGTSFSQIRAFYGVLFKANEEAAFATFHTWYSLGFFISFVYSNFICTYVKIYVLLAVSTAGFAGYLAVERRHAAGNIRH